MPQGFEIRSVVAADATVVARHRAAMFSEMGVLPSSLVERLVAGTSVFLQRAIVSGEYRGWLASPDGAPGQVVAGAGVQVRQVLPFPRQFPDGRHDVAHGRQAIVINVYTDPAYRRRGVARAIMHEVLAWARDAGLDSLVLHAAPDGRPLYESLGFAATNEMRFMGDLAAWRRQASDQ